MSAIEYIEASDDEMEVDSTHSEHSESSDDERKQMMNYIETACKFLTKKELVEVGHLVMKELAEFQGETRKVKAPRSQGSLKHQAWIDWVLARCQKEGWAEFETTSKKTGVTKKYAAAGQVEDKIVFCDNGKPFNRAHAIVYASLCRETSWYSEFESTYKPEVVASVIESKKATKEAEAEAKKQAALEKKQAAAEKKQAALEKKIAAQKLKDEENQRKLNEKAAKEAAAKLAVSAIKPVIAAAPIALAKIVAPVKAAPTPVIRATTPPPVLKKKVVVWERPAKGATAWRTIGDVRYACDHYDNLFVTNAEDELEFVGRVHPVTGKVDDTAEQFDEEDKE